MTLSANKKSRKLIRIFALVCALSVSVLLLAGCTFAEVDVDAAYREEILPNDEYYLSTDEIFAFAEDYVGPLENLGELVLYDNYYVRNFFLTDRGSLAYTATPKTQYADHAGAVIVFDDYGTIMECILVRYGGTSGDVHFELNEICSAVEGYSFFNLYDSAYATVSTETGTAFVDAISEAALLADENSYSTVGTNPAVPLIILLLVMLFEIMLLGALAVYYAAMLIAMIIIAIVVTRRTNK